MSSSPNWGIAACAAAAAVAACPAAQANSYRIVDLGAGHEVVAINKRGDVAGRSGSGSAQRALIYHGEGRDQGQWDKLGSHGKSAFSTAIGDGRDVVGAADDVPVIWIGEKGKPMQLGMPDDFVSGFASGVYSFNEPGAWRGVIAGTYTATNGTSRCFRTDDGLVVTEDFPGKGDFCSATAISSDLEIVGGANREPGGPVFAFNWQRSTFNSLAALPDGNPPYSIAMAVSPKDGAVGCSNTANSVHAVQWHQGKITDIGASKEFPGGTCAYSISRGGDFIVGAGTDASGNPSALRFEGGNVIRLSQETEGLGKWDLQKALNVGDEGVIVGNGLLDGKPHGFMLVPQ